MSVAPLDVLGTGSLAEALREKHGVAEGGGDIPLLCLVSEEWISFDELVSRHALAFDATRSWLGVIVQFDQVLIGPRTGPPWEGCGRCLEYRDANNQRSQAGYRRAVSEVTSSRRRRTPLLDDACNQTVAAVVAELCHETPSGRSRFATVSLKDLSWDIKDFTPVAGCVCDRKKTQQATKELRFEGVPSFDGHHARGKDYLPLLHSLEPALVDARYGVIRHMEEREFPGLVTAAAHMPMRALSLATGYGRSTTRSRARLIAILEGLERLGAVPGRDTDAVLASFNELQVVPVLDPRTLGLHPSESYADPEFRYKEFDPDKNYRWVRGRRLSDNETILVPEGLAFYGVGQQGDPDQAILYEVSNGCALGASIEEAALYGLLEVIERDAFLRHWYLREPAPRILPESVRDEHSRVLMNLITAEYGMEVQILDVSQEFGVPSVWALALDSGDGPCVVSAGGAALDPVVAIRNALIELMTGVAGLVIRWADAEQRERGVAMQHDPYLVRDISDHALAFGSEASRSRLDFVETFSGTVDASQLPQVPFHGDIGSTLAQVSDSLCRHGHDVIVVDQTDREHESVGVVCVKVLVPGSVPMTFGHANRRIRALPRLSGATSGTLEAEVPNPWPHPFL